ncbi:MAG: Flp pilus assembly complex ATPase component TadA [Homoserinimonas sp.]|nr:Flp pilus assembly complex ATPase component TadA [Homoserinimonas sp.]
MDAVLSQIAQRVRQRVQREGADLGSDGELAARLVSEEVRRHSELALGGSVPRLADEAAASRTILASLTGFGALQPLLDDEEIEEIWINSPTEVFVAKGGKPEPAGIVLTSSEVRDLVERMLQSSGRRVDLSSPFVDASLPDGSRLHVVIPDVTQRHWVVNIRKFGRQVRELAQLVSLGSMPRNAAEFLRMCVLAGQNILVSGATQSGKTTLLGALLSSARAGERIVTVEETFELQFSARDSVAMQCRQPSLEGTGEITLRRLIKEALRMRPDRLVVGEVREAEALDLLIALNSGLPGMCSIHANSAREALGKLCTLPLLAGRNIGSSFIVPTVASSIDLVVHCTLNRSGTRRITEILAPTGEVVGGVVQAEAIFEMEAGLLVPTGIVPARVEKFELAGLDPRPLIEPDVASIVETAEVALAESAIAS